MLDVSIFSRLTTDVNITLRAKTQDLHLPKFAMVVNLEFTHNHGLNTADALKHRNVSEETVAASKGLYAKGHSPSSALNSFKMDLQTEHGPEYVLKAADRATCPDLQFCHRLYRKVYEKAYGAASGENMSLELEALIKS
ncbi:hypothetical protein GJAV_G00245120 [Gymnothorax javanicus]|nr:hypothetical protein GJAV_G00245120 [Gymnothorax javanicus]